MHRIWLVNLDELVPNDDILYESMYVPEMVKKNFVRYLTYVETGDIFISTVSVPDDFVEYICAVNCLPKDRDWLINLEEISTPYSLVDSIFMNENVMARLKELGKSGEWKLEPYVETPKILRLSEATGIPTSKTPPCLIEGELIRKLNHKGYLVGISEQVGIETIPGYYADSLSQVISAIRKIGSEIPGKIILKKVEYAGGAGNLVGEAESLIQALPLWYNRGGVIVEPLLDLKQTAGSLVVIDDNECEFKGIDAQIFENGKWVGFQYPFHFTGISDEIKEKSLKYAYQIQAMGARGYLNMDWAIISDSKRGYKSLPLEINFRHNGLSCILELAMRYLRRSYNEIHIYYHGHFKVKNPDLKFCDFLDSLRKMSLDGEPILIDRPGMKRGIIAVTPFMEGEVGLALMGESPIYIEKLRKMLENI